MTEEIRKPEEKSEMSDRLEIIITVLLGLTTLLGATAAYFSALWGGTQHSNYSKCIAGTNHANTIYLEALGDMSSLDMDDLKDDTLYAEWKQNVSKGDPDAKYYFARLSEGLQKDLQDNPNDISEYEKEQADKIKQIEATFKEADANHDTADSLMQAGELANKNGDGFTLMTVMFTIVLFFLGLASLKTKKKLRKIYVGFSVVILIAAIIKMLTLPFPSL